jgi:tRNA nucleotidyltransferase (CCA-adding enzyme)
LVTLARADIAGKGSALTPLEVSVIDHLEERVRNMKDTEVIPTSTSVLAVNGKDVMEVLGIAPGPIVGKVLNKLLEIVTDNPDLNTRESLLKVLGGIKGRVQDLISIGSLF